MESRRNFEDIRIRYSTVSQFAWAPSGFRSSCIKVYFDIQSARIERGAKGKNAR